jgi:hypothetical protein
MLADVFAELSEIGTTGIIENTLGDDYEYFVSKANDIISFFAVFTHELYYLTDGDILKDTFSKLKSCLAENIVYMYCDELSTDWESLRHSEKVIVYDRTKTLYKVADKVAEIFGIEK